MGSGIHSILLEEQKPMKLPSIYWEGIVGLNQKNAPFDSQIPDGRLLHSRNTILNYSALAQVLEVV